jgi:hypothetical protein
VKVTGKPKHTGFTDGTMVILTGNSGFTVVITWFEFAGLPVAQVALEVNTH